MVRLVEPGDPADWINNFQRFFYRCAAAASETDGKNQQQSQPLCWTPSTTAGENNLSSEGVPIKQLIAASAVLPTDFKS